MELKDAIDIVKTLARGINPTTGEMYPADSLYNHPQIIRAFYTLLERVPKPKKSPEERREENVVKGFPKNAGLPWREEERTAVAESFRNGVAVDQLATIHERTKTAIVAELIRQDVIKIDEGEKILGTKIPTRYEYRGLLSN